MRIPDDLKGILKRKWSYHAARDIPYLFVFIHLGGYINSYPKFIGLRYQHIMAMGRGKRWLMWRDERDINELRLKIFKKLQNRAYVENSFRKIKGGFRRFLNFGKELSLLNFQELNNFKLAELIKKYDLILPQATCAASTIIELMTAFGQKIEKEISSTLTEKEKKEIMSSLSSPHQVTTDLKEEIGFYRLILKIGKKNYNQLSPQKKKLVSKHFQKYQWLSVYVNNPPWSKKDFLERLSQAQSDNVHQKLKHLNKNRIITKKRINQLIKEHHFRDQDIKILREMTYYRIEAEGFYSFTNFYILDLFKEIGQRLKIKSEDVWYLRPKEVVSFLLGKKFNYQSFISQRRKYYLLITGKKHLHEYLGAEAERVFKSLKFEDVRAEKKQKEISGIAASPGKARGKVKVILDVKEINKVRNGEILITQNTTPTYLPAMKKSAAIVTDEGGITCHAAIVSRELGIPCVIATKIATEVLYDGDIVEVNGNHGVVTVIKRNNN